MPQLKTKAAKQLRRSSTDAEKRLWQNLRNRALGGNKFRRQQPIGPYVADFVCLELKLIVELDGGQHAEQTPKDDVRTAFLNQEGYSVLRFWNNDVIANMDGVLQRIVDSLLRNADESQPLTRR